MWTTTDGISPSGTMRSVNRSDPDITHQSLSGVEHIIALDSDAMHLNLAIPFFLKLGHVPIANDAYLLEV